jgi:hypothetical protein
MTENIQELQAFVGHHKFARDDFGRGKFQGQARLHCASCSFSEEMAIKFSFFSDFEDGLVLEEIGGFVAGKAPIGFKTDFGLWACEGGILRITGNYYHLGKYTLTVSV